MPVMILFCGLTVDIGMLELRQLQLQNAADAAALGGQIESERGTNNWVAQGQSDASANGFTNGVNGVTVTLVQQPSTGAYAGHYDAIQATVSQTVQTVFMGTLNGGHVTLQAQSVALITPCVYLTGTGSLQRYSLDVANGYFNGDSCPIYINTGMNVESYGQMAVNATNVAGSSGSSSNPGFLYPSPVYNAAKITDPLAAITSPSFSGTCNHTSYNLSSGSATLSPGNYCKGITLSSSTVTMNPGLYIITGGVTWSGATVSGTGVTLFFTQGGGASYGQIVIQSGSNVTISAPNDTSSGAIPGVLIFTDRNWTHTNQNDIYFGNSTIRGDGIWYLPGAGLWMQSCGTFGGPHYMGIVADHLTTGGTIVNPTNNYSYVVSGNPFVPIGGLVQ